MLSKSKDLKHMAHQVFISYANEKGTGSKRDFQVAEEIYNTLKAKNIPCWMASRPIISAGADWINKIFDALDESRVVVLVFSSNANKSPWVKREINYALDKNIMIIPFIIENVSPQGTFRALKSNFQYLEAYASPLQDHINELVKDVQRHLGTVPGKADKTSESNEQPQPLKEKIQEPDDMPEDVKAVQSKCKKVYKNKKGFWEADYGDDIIMVYIPLGEFTMGSNEKDNEKPPHTVFLDGYWMGKYEVTFDQYDKYCGEKKKK
jgi:hypothetical protein